MGRRRDSSSGARALVAQLRQHPLTRALRVDKSTLAALQATLLHYARGEAEREIPVWRMIATPLDVLADRAARLAAVLQDQGLVATVVPAQSTVGGGSLPGEMLPTWAVALAAPAPDALAASLRRGAPPVIVRIADDRLLFDLRTVAPDEDETLLSAVVEAWARTNA